MKYGFGIIGLGMIANFHAQAIQAVPDAQLTACLSRSEDKAAGFSHKYGCKGYSDIAEFLSHPGLDIVTICTPSGAHLEPALAAAGAGKHLIIEKPLEITNSRCDQIIEVCEKAGVRLAGIFPSRFQSVSGVIKRALEQGRFGRLVLGDAYVKWFRTQEYYDHGGWHGTRNLDGGGALMNQSIHAIDLLQWFMGGVEAVQAFTGTTGHTGIEVEDNAVAVLRFKNGAFGVVEGSTSVFPGYMKRIEISGTEGSCIFEEDYLRAWDFETTREEDDGIEKECFSRADAGSGASDPAGISFIGHQRQFENFIETLYTGRKPLVDGQEAKKAVKIILAIYRSAEKGKIVYLD